MSAINRTTAPNAPARRFVLRANQVFANELAAEGWSADDLDTIPASEFPRPEEFGDDDDAIQFFLIVEGF